MNTIYFLLSGLIAGIIIVYLKNFIVKKFTKKIPALLPEHFSGAIDDISNTIDKVKEKYTESFSGKKLTEGLLKVNNGVLWAKDFASIFNLRKLIIVGIILGVIYGYGYYQGHINKPVQLNLQGKEVTIKLNEHFLKIEKNGDTKVIDKDGKVLKIIKVKDIPELSKLMRPYGFELLPFFTAGGSVGTTAQTEVGLGMQLAHWYKMNFSPFITSAGLYPLGLGYKITDNSDILLGYGLGYGGDTRYYLGIKFRF